jgi:hypothetical protein
LCPLHKFTTQNHSHCHWSSTITSPHNIANHLMLTLAVKTQPPTPSTPPSRPHGLGIHRRRSHKESLLSSPTVESEYNITSSSPPSPLYQDLYPGEVIDADPPMECAECHGPLAVDHIYEEGIADKCDTCWTLDGYMSDLTERQQLLEIADICPTIVGKDEQMRPYCSQNVTRLFPICSQIAPRLLPDCSQNPPPGTPSPPRFS